MKKRNITILAIGDKTDFDSYKKFHKDRRFIVNSGFDYRTVDYKHLLAGKIPEIATDKVIIFPFFPFYYWNKYIEHKKYKGVYGNMTFFRKFLKFSEKLNKIIKNSYRDKEIFFINNPVTSAIYRDKVAMKKKLREMNIPTPKSYHIKGIKEMERLLNKGHSFFTKVRCGSMGKGITYLSWSDWETNFAFKNGKIISRRSDYGWRFRDITGNKAFLRELLKKDIIIEDAIDSLVLNKMQVDLRIYTFFNKVLYVYPRRNHPDEVTTNISQGGKGDPELLRILPKRLLIKAKKKARKVSRALGFNLMGIDVVMDRNLKDVYVIDINAFSGFPKRRTFDLSGYMIKELVKLTNKGKLHFKKASHI